MAEFSVREVEGMRQVRIDIREETVRARRGAMSNMRGTVKLTPRLPRAGDIVRSFFTSEARIRPFYSGSGSILLQPSLGGYHILDVEPGERWILEPGVYWASEGTVELGLTREPFWSSLWAGDGFFVWKTVVSGHGRVAINAPGPVETVPIELTPCIAHPHERHGLVVAVSAASGRASRRRLAGPDEQPVQQRRDQEQEADHDPLPARPPRRLVHRSVRSPHRRPLSLARASPTVVARRSGRP